jgi:hypothetical protein
MRQAALAFGFWFSIGTFASAEAKAPEDNHEDSAPALFERICLQSDLHAARMMEGINQLKLPQLSARSVDVLIRGVLPRDRIGFSCESHQRAQCFTLLTVAGRNTALDRRLVSMGLSAESDRIDPEIESLNPLTGGGTGNIGGKSCTVYGRSTSQFELLAVVSSMSFDGSPLNSPTRVSHFNNAKPDSNGAFGNDDRWTNYYWSLPGNRHLNISFFLDRTESQVNLELSFSAPVKLGADKESYTLEH